MPIPVDPAYLWSQVLNFAVLLTVQFSGGLLVKYKNFKVNYTRKINHFALFFIPIYFNRGHAHDGAYGFFAVGAILAVAKFIFYTRPFRERFYLIRTMFASFDRPEDRPHTLLWLTTQTAAGYLVLLPMGVVFAQLGLEDLILIPLLIYGIGDGLAEPVGIRFGRHPYKVPAIFSRRTYYRTWEGSACVFVVSLVVVLLHHSYFSPVQLMAAAAVIPLLMTAAEGISPHTWDSPLMFAVGFASLWFLQRL